MGNWALKLMGNWALKLKKRAYIEEAEAFLTAWDKAEELVSKHPAIAKQLREQRDAGRWPPGEEQLRTMLKTEQSWDRMVRLLARFHPLSWRKPADRIHRPPGFKLQGTAASFFSRKTNLDVFEPVIRDLQDEHMKALAQGRLRKAQWVRVRDTWSFWAAVAAQLPTSLLKWLKAFAV